MDLPITQSDPAGPAATVATAVRLKHERSGSRGRDAAVAVADISG